MDKKTPLYDTHVKYGGRIVEFGGFLLPVQYETGIVKEHMAVRTQAGIFDVSHMGEILVQGEKAVDFLNLILTNNYTDLAPGYARYSPMCNENGGTVDDLIVYMKAPNDYFVVVNASNTDKDFAWMCDHKIDGVELTNVSEQYGQVALQGPAAETILRKVCDEEYIPGGYYTCKFDGEIKGIPCMISRTGYTGEDGFEIYMPADKAADMWELLIEAGKDDGLIPCALGARDTLRMEAAMPLYGHELEEDISPKTAGLGFAIKMDKPDFIGKAALEADTPLKQRRVGLKVTGRGIVREHLDVYKDGKIIGHTTSGTKLPYLDGAYAMAIVDSDAREIGSSCEVDVRGRMVECEMVKLPFYKREK
ncbi:MAG: glycine cleavage system aminomethyltransferase GcvT [Clostridiales bacterium]|nr:glycine cleavage system aminomethyltransferase GcvT [Candidatus Crickella caballi]